MPKEWLMILADEHPLATLHELKTQYSVADCYDLLEVMDARRFLTEESRKESKNATS